MLSRSQVEHLDKNRLADFVDLAIPEGPLLDYKSELSGKGGDATAREFLKDVSAFANAYGGVLLFGICEPTNTATVDERIRPIPDCQSRAQDLERLAASSLEPRVPGLLIRGIPLDEASGAIVIHVPQSLVRPHMVIHKKHRSFYIRHSESSVPMSAHEIRDSVLASATAEGKALSYCEEREADARQNLVQDQPAFLMQAMPLIPLAERWETTTDAFVDALRGSDRACRYRFNIYTLQSNVAPTPTIRGIRSARSRKNLEWLAEAHRNGYVQAICYAEYPNDRLILHEGYFDLFAAFLDLVEACVAAGPGDSPYVLRLALLNSKGAIFQGARDRYAHVEPLRERELRWPDWIRQVGDPFMDACESWCNLLYNAFGLAWRIGEHPVRERALRGDL